VQKRRSWVAVVDDESDLADLFSDVLNSNGINAIAFDDPLAALHNLDKYHNKFILVVTDWRMPAMSGLELAKVVQRMDDQIRIVVMSAFDLERDQFEEIGISEYLKKPMHIAQFIKAVKSQLAEPSLLTAN